jgi:GT2 family glycosyltransferase
MKGKIGEALAHGLPVVTTSVGSEGMELARVAAAADTPEAFAAAVVELYRDDAEWSRVSAAGRELVQVRWSSETVARALDDLIRDQHALQVDDELTSIVILAHGALDQTRACLQSIERSTPEPHELILVDNGSKDGTREFFREYAETRSHVTVVANQSNRGFAAGNNQGLALARGGTICLLNNDTVVTPGWLERMRAVLEREPQVGLVGPVTNRISGPQQIATSYEDDAGILAAATERAASYSGKAAPFDHLVGFCLLLRRDVVDRIGGLDERFGHGNFEDDDFSVRAGAEGFEGRIALDAFVHHEGSKTFETAAVDYQQQYLRNWGLFKTKWSMPADAMPELGFAPSPEAIATTCRWEPLTPVGWSHARVGMRRWEETFSRRAMSQGASAVARGSADELREAFAEAGAWADPHRRYQMRVRLTEVVLDTQSTGDSWLKLFAATAGCLLDALEDAPAEPLLLLYTGVLLYELGDHRGAEALFRAVKRLEPENQHVDRNLRAVRQAKKSQIRLHPAVAREVNELSPRAVKIANAADPAQGMRVSLCMIVKDEEEMLPGCLEPVYQHVDELIVVDTGSSDRTVEIAESFGAKVMHFPWNGSFADARNVGLDAATGDWILYLDADEHVLPEDGPKIRELLGRTWREAFHLVETNYTGNDETGGAVTHLALRLFRNRPEYRFEGRIHEQKTQRMPTYLPERFETAPVRMVHYGYLKGRIVERGKSRRNIDLLERDAQEQPNPFTFYNLGSEYGRLGDVERARDYFERSWSLLGQSWSEVGYATSLVARLAGARRRTGDHTGVAEVAEAGLRVFPDHTDLVLELAGSAWDNGLLDEAERHARRCLEMGDAPAQYVATVGTGTFLALHLLAEVLAARGETAAAEELWRRSLAEYPNYGAAALPLAGAMLARGATPAEVEAIVPGDRPSAALMLATAFGEAGLAEAAERWFLRVLERQPDNGVARVGLVEALLSQCRYADAAAEAAHEPQDSPYAPMAANATLFAAAAGGDVATLAAALEAPRVGEAIAAFYRAWAAVLTGGDLAPVPLEATGTALTALEALLRVQDIDAYTVALQAFSAVELPARQRREVLARIYFRRGFLESAADEWIAAVQEQPDAAALVGLAQVAQAQGLHADALVFAEEAVALEPESREAHLLRERLLAIAA